MENETVRVMFANDSELDVSLDNVKSWTPTEIRTISDTTFFKVGGLSLSMKTINFNNIFKQ